MAWSLISQKKPIAPGEPLAFQGTTLQLLFDSLKLRCQLFLETDQFLTLRWVTCFQKHIESLFLQPVEKEVSYSGNSTPEWQWKPDGYSSINIDCNMWDTQVLSCLSEIETVCSFLGWKGSGPGTVFVRWWLPSCSCWDVESSFPFLYYFYSSAMILLYGEASIEGKWIILIFLS